MPLKRAYTINIKCIHNVKNIPNILLVIFCYKVNVKEVICRLSDYIDIQDIFEYLNQGQKKLLLLNRLSTVEKQHNKLHVKMVNHNAFRLF